MNQFRCICFTTPYLTAFLVWLVILPHAKTFGAPQAGTKPNIIFILADDLGYGDLGCYGQRVIKTPRLDQMAAEGIRFTNFYAGNTVCAPSRSVLMTGQHMGHTHVRGNAGAEQFKQALRDQDVTVAEVLKSANYQTALCGKWGLGDDRDGARTGLPNRQGFDYFYGYLNQTHAHNYYPEYLWRNETKVPLRNVVTKVAKREGRFQGGYATKRIDYSHDLVADEAVQFVKQNASDKQPFFLYMSLTIPHANNEGTRGTGDGQEVPDYGPYTEKEWSNQDKGQAAMITRMDGDVGRILDLLDELNIDKTTLVIFSSDNGPHNEGGHDPKRFQPSGPLRGMKRALYEGGIRVPMIARWPGTIKANSTSDHIGYFGDLMATACELSGVEPKADLDSISFLPSLLGQTEQQKKHRYLYWEFYEQGGRQAVRAGQWKAVKNGWMNAKTELYDLNDDLGEQNNIADQHPEIVERLEGYMKEAHRPHPNWKVRGRAKKPKR